MIGIGRNLEIKVGFGFRPTDDELVGYFLRNRIEGNLEVLESINEVDICSFDPWELRLQAKIKSRDPIWYFFSRRENKYASGNRQSRRTISGSGFWKLTGESVAVKDQWGTWCGYAGNIGQKRVLGFHRGKSGSSKGVKSDWVIHEYHFTLLPEEKRTYVVCRLEYKGDDRNMLTDSAIEPAPTQSAGSVINQSLHGNSNTFAEYDSATQGQQFNGFLNPQQSLQGYSGSYNNLSEYDSANQGQQFNGFSNLQQSLQGYSESYNNLSEYDSANQGQHLSGNFNMQQSVQGNSESFIHLSDFGYDLADQGQWFNQQPLVPYSDEWENLVEQNIDNLIYETTYMEQNNSNYLPKKPVAGVLADDDSDSDTDSMICKDAWSSTDSVASSNGSYHTPYSLPSSTIKPLRNYKAQERPKSLLKLQVQRKEKLINKQMSECKCEMSEDLIKKASSIKMVNKNWIVLEEMMSRRNSEWVYLMKMIIGFLLLFSIIGWIILAD